MSAAATAAAAAGRAAPPASAPVIADIDLSGPFATRSAWSFTATQGPPIDDPFGSDGDQVPGVVHPCLRSGAAGPCDPHLQATFADPSSDDLFSEPHFLERAQIVHPKGSGRPLLLVRTASLASGNGDQVVLTQVLVYGRDSDQFTRAYAHRTGRNNNQEVRYLEAGPLGGDIISVEPTEDAPYGFWVSVNAFTSADAYNEVLRYRSATHYSDGNPLPVIDSEMPNIQRRLGLWQAGTPMPVPASNCPRPHLIHWELWCS